ncbi:hypothetical protein N0V94_005787 [Neodidymelliopsis sp. IMI 364377]|nr:hypothetical protein N0V94_005787 [Neodidymelliopsis sp. IMI 364377]
MANPPSSSEFDWKMYRYVPSLALGILFVILFSIMAAMHTFAYCRHRKANTIYMILGALCEIAGFSARIASHYNNQSWAPFIIQGTLLLIGPLFFAATVYMMLGQLIVSADAASVSRIRPVWYTRLFVGADVSTLVVQGLGASLMGTMQLSLALAGEKVVIAGLALQVFTFILFLCAALDFQIRMQRRLGRGEMSDSNGQWKSMLKLVYTLSALILFRCVFRLVEYAMGNAAYLIAHEWTLYAFDAVPMMTVLILLFVFWSRGNGLGGERKESEEKGSGSDEETGGVM